MTQRVAIEVGWDVFVQDGASNFGSVREVHESYLVVFVEGHGDVIVEATSVHDVHHGKVIVDVETLDAKVRTAIGHAHDAESR